MRSVDRPTPVVSTAAPAAALENGLARAPQTGFDDWYSTQCRSEFDEAMVEGIADIFVKGGPVAAGRPHVNVDDCFGGAITITWPGR